MQTRWRLGGKIANFYAKKYLFDEMSCEVDVVFCEKIVEMPKRSAYERRSFG